MRSLSEWTPAEPLPSGARDHLPALIAKAERGVEPADAKAFAVVMDGFFRWVERFRVVVLGDDDSARTRVIGDTVAGYREALSDLPADLLDTAFKRVMGEHRFRNLPLPGEIRQVVADELRARGDQLRKLNTAKLIADRSREQIAGPIDRSEAARDRVSRLVREACSSLESMRPATPARERERDDDAPQTADHRRRVAEEIRSRRVIPMPRRTA